MKTLFILPFLAALIFVGACESEAPTEPIVNQPDMPVYSARLVAAPLIWQAPFTTTLWGEVGGQPESVELLLNGEHYADSPDTVFTVPEPGNYVFVLVASYTDSTITDTQTIVGQPEQLGAPLQANLAVAPKERQIPYPATIQIYAAGGEAPYHGKIYVDDELLAESMNATYVVESFGVHRIVAVVTDNRGDSVTLQDLAIGASADQPAELQGTMVLAPKRAEVGTPVFISAVAMGGVPSYHGRIEVDGQTIAGGFTAVFTPQEARGYQVRCYIYDSAGQTVVMEDMIDAYRPDQNTVVTWSVATDLAAGPYGKHDSESVAINQGQYYSRIWFLVKMDVRDEDRQTMTLEFIYADGTRRYWQIPDVIQDRPAQFVVDGGEAWIEPVVEVNWYYPGGTSDLKCDSWNRVLEISGSYQLPAAYQGLDKIKVKSSDKKPLNISG